MRQSGFQMMQSLFVLVLIIALSGPAIGNVVEEEGEIIYSSASSLHDLEENGPESPSKSRNLNLESLDDVPLVVIQPNQEITVRSDEDIINNIVKLIQSVSSSAEVDDASSPESTSREAKQLNLGATGRIRSLFNIPFNHGQGFIPRTPLGSNIFSGINFNNPSTGWQQRFKNTFSNLFSFGRPNQMLPYGGIGMAASTNNPSFLPYPQNVHASYNPYIQQAPAPNIWNQYQAQAPQQMEDLSNAASYGHPTRLQLGNTFNPYNVPQQQFVPQQPFVPQQQFGSDLAMSGSVMSPHQAMQAANFGRYVSTVPRHKPLFDNVGGLKGASLEMSNAFADFADSHEHGPEVTQKFGSVGHTINTFLGMMGLGAQGGISPDDVGGFGGAGDYASMDSTPISRSMDFYPGYGNQAVLEEMEDYPIFQEDITREYLTKMNLTHLLDHVSIYEKEESSDNEDNETAFLKIIAKEPEMKKEPNPEYNASGVDDSDVKPYSPVKTLYQFIKDPMVHDEPWYAPAQYLNNQKDAETQEKSENQGNKLVHDDKDALKHYSLEDTKPFTISNTKKPWFLDGKPKSSEHLEKESPATDDHKSPNNCTNEADIAPIVDFKVPPTDSPVAFQDQIPPIATFQGLPDRSNPDAEAPEPPKYALNYTHVASQDILPPVAAFQGFPARSNPDAKAPEPPKYDLNYSPVASQDKIPPVATFQGFPARSNPDAKAPEPPKYDLNYSPVASQDKIPPVATFQGFPARSNPDAKAPEPPKYDLNYSPVASQDRIPFVATFQGFPARSNPDVKAPEPPSYAPAHSLPHHESEENPNQLIDDNSPRSWVAFSSGRGYVEKRPKPIHEINPEEIPKGLSIVHQMLSGISQHESLQE